jgi:hypothetical protein
MLSVASPTPFRLKPKATGTMMPASVIASEIALSGGWTDYYNAHERHQNAD